MLTSEANLYLNFTKSIIDGFDDFITSIEKHGGIIGDHELKQKLKHISKRLQSVFNKWENTPNRNCVNSSVEETVTQNATENETKPQLLERSDSLDDFESMIAHSVGDIKSISKISATEVAGTSSKLDFSIFDDDVTSTPSTKEAEIPKSPLARNKATSLTRKEAEIVRKFKVENVKEEWIRGSGGFYVVESSRGSWKCIVCKLEALSSANIISHASGKAHIKKIDSYNRDTSETRQTSDSSLNFDSSLATSDTELELANNVSNAGVIVPFKIFFCTVCRKNLSSEEEIKLHVSGGKHRKNCQL